MVFVAYLASSYAEGNKMFARTVLERFQKEIPDVKTYQLARRWVSALIVDE
jgi:hypothetical protein